MEDKRKHSFIRRIPAMLFWLFVWQLGSMAVSSEILLVGPVKVVQTLLGLVGEGVFWRSVGFSLRRIFGGFLLAALLGSLLAALASRFRVIRELLSPLMLTVRTVPVASFIILALIWFSSKNLSVLISFLMVLPIIYTGVLTGIAQRDARLQEMARVFRARSTHRLLMLDLPQVYPYFRSACKTALGLAWKSGIAAEVIGMPKGSIGEHLQQAKVYLDTPSLFAWTVVIVLISLLCEQAVVHLLDAGMGLVRRWKG
ncbi:MAG: ABC transporter permease subunit [Clostridia bacterium]|nr:ABC transporter permease subunit [Clostridia bacterium]